MHICRINHQKTHNLSHPLRRAARPVELVSTDMKDYDFSFRKPVARAVHITRYNTGLFKKWQCFHVSYFKGWSLLCDSICASVHSYVGVFVSLYFLTSLFFLKNVRMRLRDDILEKLTSVKCDPGSEYVKEWGKTSVTVICCRTYGKRSYGLLNTINFSLQIQHLLTISLNPNSSCFVDFSSPIMNKKRHTWNWDNNLLFLCNI